MPVCWLPIPDMYTDSGSNEMGCAAILMAQHSDDRAPVRQLGLILRHSQCPASLSAVVPGLCLVV